MDGSSASADRVNKYISEIYQAALGARFAPDALASLADQTASGIAIWGKLDLDHGHDLILHSYNIDPSFVAEYNLSGGYQNPWLRHRDRLKCEGHVWRGAQIVPLHELTRSAFYKRMLAPHAIHHTLHLVVAVDAETAIHVTLGRSRSRPGYGESEIGFARLFAFHSRCALEIGRDAVRKKTVQSVLLEVIDEAGIGVAIIERSSFIYASETCRTIFAAVKGNSPNGHSLLSEVEGPNAPLSLPPELAMVLAKHDGKTATTLFFEGAHDSRRYIAKVQPVFFDDPQFGRRPAIALTVRDTEARFTFDEELLKSTFRLTNSEARVCALLANGSSVDEISKTLAISPLTVRTHLQRIYRKTHSTRQAELIKLVQNAARKPNSTSMIEVIKTKPSRPTRTVTEHRGKPRFGGEIND